MAFPQEIVEFRIEQKPYCLERVTAAKYYDLL
jgi:hypothetical protein